MSVVSEDPPQQQSTLFTPVLPPRFALGGKHVVFVAALAVFFIFLNLQTLRHTDLWSHVRFGQWILDHGQLPTEDPIAPLSRGMRVVDSAWLSQVVLAQIERWGGAEWLANTFVLVVFWTYLVWARVFFLQTGRLATTLAGLLLVGIVGWSRLTTIRPEMFGALAFAVLCWLLVRSEVRAARESSPGQSHRRLFDAALWIGVPLLMVAWANLHGSFMCGLALLACCWLGESIAVGLRTRSLRAVFQDPPARRLLVLTELAIAATLLNPYGIDLLIFATGFTTNSNLRDILEWAPLRFTGVGGWEFALSWIVLLVVWRRSPRPIHPREVLLLGLFGLASIMQIRMLAWYAPVFALVTAPHLGAMADRRWPRRSAVPKPQSQASSRSTWTYTLSCLLLVWIAFNYSNFWRLVTGGPPRPPERLYSPETPRGATAYLRENPPSGQVWNPQYWGDWLVWDGPPGLQPFVTTQLHLAPAEVWKNYTTMYTALPGWPELFDRYRVSTVVLDKKNQTTLTAVLRQTPGWNVRYEDEQALILERTPKEAPTEAQPTSAAPHAGVQRPAVRVPT